MALSSQSMNTIQKLPVQEYDSTLKSQHNLTYLRNVLSFVYIHCLEKIGLIHAEERERENKKRERENERVSE